MCLKGNNWLYIDGYWFEGDWMVKWNDGWKFYKDGYEFEFIDGNLVREDWIYYSIVRQELVIFNDKIKNVKDIGNNQKMTDFIGGDFC